MGEKWEKSAGDDVSAGLMVPRPHMPAGAGVCEIRGMDHGGPLLNVFGYVMNDKVLVLVHSVLQMFQHTVLVPLDLFIPTS